MTVEVNNDIDSTKASVDKKQYRHISLDNGLQCLLISSINESKKNFSHLTAAMEDRHISVRHPNFSAVRESVTRGVLAFGEEQTVSENTEAFGRSLTRLNLSEVEQRISGNFSHLSYNMLPKKRFHNSSRKSTRNITIPMPQQIRSNNRISLISENRPVSIGTARSFKRTSTQISGKKLMATMVDINQSKVSLIENPDIKMAYVSLAVGVGSFAEPHAFNGLAHFLEHMLFMGTAKFPQENKFDKLLAMVGGTSNAYTDSERTVYYFTCPQQNLAEVLDVFSQFFVSALLLPERGDREIDTVEEEFRMRQNMDNCRLMELWRHTSRTDSPFSRFTCGNKKTLTEGSAVRGSFDSLAPDEYLYEALKDFYRKYYVGDNMRLVIHSHDTLENLQSLVEKFFSEVQSLTSKNSRGRTNLDFSHKGVAWRLGVPATANLLKEKFDGVIWEDILRHDLGKVDSAIVPAGKDGASLGCIFRIVPVQETNELILSWQLPPQSRIRREGRSTEANSSLEYVCCLLGYDCKGSILYETKRKGLITDLRVVTNTMDGNEDNTIFTMFTIQVSLTKKGVKEWYVIISLIFQYIGMLVRAGPQKWFSDEIAEAYRIGYHYQEENEVISLVQEISVRMLPQWGYDVSNLLDLGISQGLKFDPKNIEYVLAQLNPYLVRIDFSSPSFLSPEEDEAEEEKPATFNNRKSRKPKKLNRKNNTDNLLHQKDSEKLWTLDSILNNPDFKTLRPFSYDDMEREMVSEVEYMVDRIPSKLLGFWVSLYDGNQAISLHYTKQEMMDTKNIALSNYGRSVARLSSLKNKQSPVSIRSVQLDVLEELHKFKESMLQFQFPPKNKYLPSDFSVKKKLIVKKTNILHTDIYNKTLTVLHNLQDSPNFYLHSQLSLKTIHINEKDLCVGRIEYISADQTRLVINFAGGIRRWYICTPALIEAIEANISSDLVLQLVFQSYTRTLSIGLGGKSQSYQHLRAQNPDDIHRSVSQKASTSDNNLSGVFHEVVKQWNPIHDITIKKSPNICPEFPDIPKQTLEKSGFPIQVAGSNSLVSVWHVEDTRYELPRGHVRIKLNNGVASVDPFHACLNELFSLALTETLREESFMAQFAELDLEISSHPHGQIINLRGFNDKLPRLLEDVLDCLVSYALIGVPLVNLESTEKRRKNYSEKAGIKKSKKRHETLFREAFSNFSKILPYPSFLAQKELLRSSYNEGGGTKSPLPISPTLYRVLVGNAISNDSKLVELERADPLVLGTYAALFLQDCQAEALVTGNFSVFDGEAVHETIANAINKITIPNKKLVLGQTRFTKMKLIKIPRAQVVDVDDEWHALSGLLHPLEALQFKNHSVDLYFHIGPNVLEDKIVSEMIEQLMTEPLFRELRTVQQLSYTVKCSSVLIHNELGFVIELTSGKSGPPELAALVDQFLEEVFEPLLTNMHPEEFFQNVAALARKKLDSFNLPSMEKYWEVVQDSYEQDKPTYQWDQVLEEVRFMKEGLTKNRVVKSFRRWLATSSAARKRVSLIVFGHNHGTNPLAEIMKRDYITIRGPENPNGDQVLRQVVNPACVIM